MSTRVWDNQSSDVLGARIVSKNITGNRATGNTPLNSTFQAVKDRATAETQLQTYNATLYTNAYLASMTNNDLVYHLRVAYDPTSF